MCPNKACGHVFVDDEEVCGKCGVGRRWKPSETGAKKPQSRFLLLPIADAIRIRGRRTLTLLIFEYFALICKADLLLRAGQGYWDLMEYGRSWRPQPGTFRDILDGEVSLWYYENEGTPDLQFEIVEAH